MGHGFGRTRPQAEDGSRFWQGCYGIHTSRAKALKAWREAPEALKKGFPDALPQRLSAPAD